MGFEDIDSKNSSNSFSSSKILVATIVVSLLICFVAIIIWVNALGRRKGKAIEALTKTTPRETVITPVISLDQEQLSISYVATESKEIKEVNEIAVVAVPKEELKVEQNQLSLPVKRYADSVTFSEYTVQSGDSIAVIAQSFGLRNQTLIQINGLKTIYPTEGTVLIIPSVDGQIYTVQEGDTFFSIAQRFSLSLSWNTLKAINGIEGDNLDAGLKLFIPHSSVMFTEQTTVSDSDYVDDFILPVRNGNVIVNFGSNIADPLSGQAKELDGIIIQTLSAADVVSSTAGTIVDRGFNTNGTSFIKILHESGYTSYYDYLTWVNVDSGQKLSKGEVIGTISEGNTKLVTPTLFFKIEQDGIALDPVYFF